MSLNIEISKDGYKILKINNNDKSFYLGSKYNQKREIEKFIGQINEITEKDNYIIFGLSFGEHIQEFLKRINKLSKVLIIEFNEELIEYCKKDININKILEYNRITITSKKEIVEKFIRENVFEINADKLKTLEYCNYSRIDNEKYIETAKLIRDLLVRIKINRNTLYNFKNKFIDNIINNLKYISIATPINKLKNSYENIPAVIVSAGPSLNKNINELTNFKNKGLILSGCRTLGSLIDRNVYVNCLGIVDPNDISYELVKNNIDRVECPLLFSDMANKKVVNYHKKEKIFYSSATNLIVNKVFEDTIDNLYGGGSIAHSLTNLAIYMGCDPIIFVGQDLAYTDNKNHSEICVNNSGDEKYIEDGTIYVEDINGGLVKTTTVLNDFRISLEDIISKNKNIRFINATEGGALINGTENIKLHELIPELENNYIEPISNLCFDNIDKYEEIIEELNNLIEVIDEYIKLCIKAEGILKDYELSYKLKNQKKLDVAINRLNEIDEKIIKNNGKLSFVNIAIDAVLFEVENNDEFIVKDSDNNKIKNLKELERSRVIYYKIKEDMVFYKKKIEEVINDN